MRFGITLGLLLPGDKANHKSRLGFVCYPVFASGALSQSENKPPCLVSSVHGTATVRVSKGQFTSGKVVRAWGRQR